MCLSNWTSDGIYPNQNIVFGSTSQKQPGLSNRKYLSAISTRSINLQGYSIPYLFFATPALSVANSLEVRRYIRFYHVAHLNRREAMLSWVRFKLGLQLWHQTRLLILLTWPNFAHHGSTYILTAVLWKIFLIVYSVKVGEREGLSFCNHRHPVCVTGF